MRGRFSMCICTFSFINVYTCEIKMPELVHATAINGSLMHYVSFSMAAYLHQNKINFARRPAFLCWLLLADAVSKLNFEGIWLSYWFCMSHPGFLLFAPFRRGSFQNGSKSTAASMYLMSCLYYLLAWIWFPLSVGELAHFAMKALGGYWSALSEVRKMLCMWRCCRHIGAWYYHSCGKLALVKDLLFDFLCACGDIFSICDFFSST